MKSGMHTFHAPQTELIILDCQKIQNRWRYFILEMDFSEHTTFERMEMDFSMAVQRISVERVKAPGVITATQIMPQMCIAICPMTIHFVEVSLHIQVRDQTLMTRGMKSFSHTVVIIARASHRRRDIILNTADISAVRITQPAGKLRP